LKEVSMPQDVNAPAHSVCAHPARCGAVAASLLALLPLSAASGAATAL